LEQQRRSLRQYGRLSFTDDGTTITVAFSGWDAAAQVERVSQTDVFVIPTGRAKVFDAGSQTWRSVPVKPRTGGATTTANVKVRVNGTWKTTR
jgi:hypothetical protein